MANDPYGPDTTDEYAPTDVGGGGAGRGFVNPPLATEPQSHQVRRGVLPRNPYVSPHESNQATWADVAKVGETALAPVEGFIRGRTMGLIDPAAMYLEHAVTGKPLQEIAQRLKANRDRMEAEHPIGSMAGEIFGGLRTGVKTLPGATAKVLPRVAGTIPGAIVEQGVQGAVGAASKELVDSNAEDRSFNPTSTAVAGGTSAGVVGALGTGGAAVQKLAATKGGKYIAEQINTLMREKPPGWQDKINKIVAPIEKSFPGTDKEVIASEIAGNFAEAPGKVFTTPVGRESAQAANTALWRPALSTTLGSIGGYATGAAADYGWESGKSVLTGKEMPTPRSALTSETAKIFSLGGAARFGSPLLSNMASRYAALSGPTLAIPAAIIGREVVPSVSELSKNAKETETTNYGPEKDPYGPD